jgi:hypothetical protein
MSALEMTSPFVLVAIHPFGVARMQLILTLQEQLVRVS